MRKLHTIPGCAIQWRGDLDEAQPWETWIIVDAVMPTGYPSCMASIFRRNREGAPWEAKVEWYDAPPCGRVARIERPRLKGAIDFATAATRFEAAFNTLIQRVPHAH